MKKKLVPHADFSSEEEGEEGDEESVTIVNPLHAHLHESPVGQAMTPGELKDYRFSLPYIFSMFMSSRIELRPFLTLSCFLLDIFGL